MSNNNIDFTNDPSGDQLLDVTLTQMYQNITTAWSGTTTPADATAGLTWLNTTSTPWLTTFYDGTDNITLAEINATTNTHTPLVNNVKAKAAAGVVIQNSAGTTVATFGASTSTATALAGSTTITVAGTDVGLTVNNTGTGNTAVFNGGAANQTITVDNAGLLQIGMTTGTAKLNIKALSNSLTDYPIYIENSAGTGMFQAGVYGSNCSTAYTADYATYVLATASTSRLTVSGSGVALFVSNTFGYGAGTGGTVTQLTSKATGATLNKQCGQITMNAAALAANTAVSFVFTNSTIAATDEVSVWVQGGAASATSYTVNVYAAAAGSVTIVLRNMTAGSLSEAVVIGFAVRKAATT